MAPLTYDTMNIIFSALRYNCTPTIGTIGFGKRNIGLGKEQKICVEDRLSNRLRRMDKFYVGRRRERGIQEG